MRTSLLAFWLTVLGPAIGLAQAPIDVPSGVSPDLLVTVRLRNGSAIHGVALEGRLVERQVRGRFLPGEDRSDRAAGVRVWYYRDLDGFLFLPYARVESIEVRGEMSASDLASLRDALRVASEERSRPTPDPTDPVDGETGDGPQLTEAERALLTEFAPEQGWGSAKYGDLQRRRILLGQTLDKKESRFVDVFEAWRAAERKMAKATPADGGARPVDPAKAKTERPRGGSLGGAQTGG